MLDMLEELENRVLVLERWENCAAFKLVTATLDRDGPEVLVSKQELAFTAVIELTETAAADVDIGTTGSSVCNTGVVSELSLMEELGVITLVVTVLELARVWGWQGVDTVRQVVGGGSGLSVARRVTGIICEG